MTLQNITKHATAHDAVNHLKVLYQTSVAQLQADLQSYLADKTKPNKALRAEGRYCYPKLIVTWNGVDQDDDEDTPVLGHRHPFVNRAFARFSRPGVYAGSITRPDLYGDFIEEQIALMQKDYDITIEVGLSDQEIPYPYVLDGADLDLNSVSAVDLARFFRRPNWP